MWVLQLCKRDTKHVTNWPPYLWNHPFSRKPLHPQHSSETQGRLHSFIQSFASLNHQHNIQQPCRF